jgi:xanthine/uracil permease
VDFSFKVASRTTMVMAGILLIFLGIFTKVGAILSTIPDPLVGGVLASSMAMVAGVAIANVQQVKNFLKFLQNKNLGGFKKF